MADLIDLVKHRAKMAKGKDLMELALEYREFLSSLETMAGLALLAVIPEGAPDGFFDAGKAARLRRLLAHLKPCVLELADVSGLAPASETGAGRPPLGA